MQELNSKLTLLLDDSTFIPKFSLLNFIQDWKKKKEMGDAQVLSALPDRKKLKKNCPVSSVGYGTNRCIRTLKFEQEIVNSKNNWIKYLGKKYTILNIYEVFPNEFEAILRWGSFDGTSINGSTLRYPVGNKVAVEYYIGHFKGFYGITNRLVLDSTAPPRPNIKSLASNNDQNDDKMSVVSSMATSDQESPVLSERKPSIVKLKVKPLRNK